MMIVTENKIAVKLICYIKLFSIDRVTISGTRIRINVFIGALGENCFNHDFVVNFALM